MKEPELEEEDLRASVNDGRLDVLRRSLSSKPATVEVTAPSGKKAQVKLADQGDGRQTGSLSVNESGLYRLTDGEHLAFAASGALNPLEFADVRSTPDKMRSIVQATGGRIFRLAGGRMPEVRMVRPGHSAGGSNWIGFVGGADYIATGIWQMPLMPPLAGLLLALAALVVAWQREGR
jgi:hypothetical protein